MSWLKWVLIALGIVVLLVLAMLAGLGMLSDTAEKEVRHISIGQRTITVSHYKDMTQESMADGVKIVADGHVITATPDAITVDGKPVSIDPNQDIEILIDESGKLEAKGVAPAAPPAPGTEEDEEQPAETAPE
jgi:hypothetical protein